MRLLDSSTEPLPTGALLRALRPAEAAAAAEAARLKAEEDAAARAAEEVAAKAVAAKAAAAKADGITFGPFGAIPSAPIPALLKLVDTIIPKGIQMEKKIT